MRDTTTGTINEGNIEQFLNENYDEIELEPVPPKDQKKETIH